MIMTPDQLDNVALVAYGAYLHARQIPGTSITPPFWTDMTEDAKNAWREVAKAVLHYEQLTRLQGVIAEGFAGVDKKGTIVDRRIVPDAVPIPANPMMRTPEPKKV
jgi:hypothetical protein